MNIDNWTQYYKYSDQGDRCMAQQTYEPLISLDRKMFCKNYYRKNSYQKYQERPLYTDDVVDFFFEQELKYLDVFSNKPYAPEILDVDYNNRRIFIKWYDKSCNEIIQEQSDWPQSEWLEKISDIVVDQVRSGIYKLTIYPHCHYIDDDNNMRAIDWYGCVPVNDPFIEEKYMQGIIHETAKFRLDETGNPTNGKLNLEIMFKKSLGKHIKWGDHNLSDVYKRVFGEDPNA